MTRIIGDGGFGTASVISIQQVEPLSEEEQLKIRQAMDISYRARNPKLLIEVSLTEKAKKLGLEAREDGFYTPSGKKIMSRYLSISKYE